MLYGIFSGSSAGETRRGQSSLREVYLQVNNNAVNLSVGNVNLV